VNVTGTLEVAEKLHRRGIYSLYLSSNQVFDGSIPRVPGDAPVNPVSLYGKHKAEVEAQLINWGSSAGILRLSKVLDSTNPLLYSWCDSLTGGQSIQAFDDYFMAPVPTAYVTELIAWLLQTRLPGVTQLSGEQDISYYDVAKLLAGQLDATALVKAESARRSGALEHVPAHTTLDCGRLQNYYATAIPSSLDTVSQILNTMCVSKPRLSVYG